MWLVSGVSEKFVCIHARVLLTKERYTRWVDGFELGEVFFKMILTELNSLLKNLPVPLRHKLYTTNTQKQYLLLISLAFRLCVSNKSSLAGHLECVVQAIHSWWVDGAYNLQNSIEVIELLKYLQNLNSTRKHSNPLLKVFGLHYTPERQKIY